MVSGFGDEPVARRAPARDATPVYRGETGVIYAREKLR